MMCLYFGVLGDRDRVIVFGLRCPLCVGASRLLGRSGLKVRGLVFCALRGVISSNRAIRGLHHYWISFLMCSSLQVCHSMISPIVLISLTRIASHHAHASTGCPRQSLQSAGSSWTPCWRKAGLDLAALPMDIQSSSSVRKPVSCGCV